MRGHLSDGGLTGYYPRNLMHIRLAACACVAVAVLVGSAVAAQKRSGVLAVRVTVNRSCSVNTAAPGVTGTVITCDSKSRPAVRTSTSTVAGSSAARSSGSAPQAITSVADSAPQQVPGAEQRDDATVVNAPIQILTVHF